MNYVYILPLIDGINMKIGVSEGDLSRLIQHHDNYGIILDQIRILNCRSKKLAFKVEKYLLNNIPKPARKILKKDGYSEIREVKHFKNCLHIINEIKNDFNFSYQESKCIEYKLYTIKEVQIYYKEKYEIDLNYQIEKLSNVDYTKYSTIYARKTFNNIRTKYTTHCYHDYK